MSEHILQTLEMVKAQVRDLESELAEKKRMANSLCELAGARAIYANTEPNECSNQLPSRGDEYYGQAMSPAMRMILEARQAANLGPATVSDIHEALVVGGYQFDAASEANEKKSVRICLSKNSSIFHKLPTGKYGLVKWYPKVRPTKKNGRHDEEEDGRNCMKEEFGKAKEDAKAPPTEEVAAT